MKKAPFILICLLMGAILAACSPSQAERDAQTAKIAAGLSATQTAQAPTPTPTPTVTPTPTPTPSLTPTPTPAPTTGSVIGHLIGRNTHQPLAGAFIVLCEITGDLKCILHADLTATADTEGRFTVKQVPPGRYTVAHAKAKNSAAVSFEDGFAIVVPFKVLEGSVTRRGLSFEFREQNFFSFDVRVGETTEVEITAWGL